MNLVWFAFVFKVSGYFYKKLLQQNDSNLNVIVMSIGEEIFSHSYFLTSHCFTLFLHLTFIAEFRLKRVCQEPKHETNGMDVIDEMHKKSLSMYISKHGSLKLWHWKYSVS